VSGLLRLGRAHAGEGGGLGAKEGKDGLVLVLWKKGVRGKFSKNKTLFIF